VSSIVLVHGAFSGAWCWHKVQPELEERGHDVTVFDLPGHGVDTTPPGEVRFEDYVSRVEAAVDAQDGPVVLVGHSMAGMVVTQVGERRPEAVDTLVYLTAYLPGDGQSMADLRVEESLVTKNFTAHESRGVGTIAEEAWDGLFYGDCSPADRALGHSLGRAEPLDPISRPVSTSEDRFGSIPRVFVACEDDRAITPTQQRMMREAVPCDEVLTLGASHSPFLSVPTETAEAIDTATRVG
jgi:pimeloyl-ACP methyl ester carboxylesterase